MTTIFDVAKYILEQKGAMTTMKLQKLCYYSQAWSLAWDEVPLFEEDFEAWANGPVCRKLYSYHRKKFEVDASDFYLGDSKNLSATQKETIDVVLAFYGDKSPVWLSELTHSENPWKDARRGVEPGDYCDNIITKRAMQEYYSGLE